MHSIGAQKARGYRKPSSLLNGLVSYWKMDEASGTRVDSAVSSGNDLTDNNTVTQTTGKVRSAAQFTAANSESLSRVSNASLSLGANESFTWAAWVNFTSLGANRAIISKRQDAGGNNIEYQMAYISATSTVDFAVFLSNGTPRFISIPGNPSTGTWLFYVGWRDAATNKLYFQVNNGTPVESATADATSTYSSNGALRMGVLFGTTFYTDAVIDEVGFWKRVLTPAERAALYNAGNGITWPFVGVE